MALAEIGYLSGFKEKLSEINKEYEIPADVISQLDVYVKSCNFPKICEYLSELSHEQ
jgi:hypothetical protein